MGNYLEGGILLTGTMKSMYTYNNICKNSIFVSANMSLSPHSKVKKHLVINNNQPYEVLFIGSNIDTSDSSSNYGNYQ
jgi:hypothetical protein